MYLSLKKLYLLTVLIIALFLIAACDLEEAEAVEITSLNVNQATLELIEHATKPQDPLVTGMPGLIIETPNDPVLEGHLFIGWFANQNLTERYLFDVMPEEDTMIYAGWEVLNYELTLEFNMLFTMETIVINDSLALMLDTDGDLWCWGRNAESAETFGSCPVKNTDGQDTLWPHDWTVDTIKAWNQQAFIITDDGRVYAWGENHFGQLGTKDRNHRDRFEEITANFMLEEGETIIDITGSSTNTYAISNTGKIFAWGRGRGISMLTGRSASLSTDGESVIDHPLNITDTLPLGPDEIIVRISASTERAFALSNEGKVYAWGRNDNQELGFEEEHETQEVFEITDLFLSGDEDILDIGGDEYGFFVIKNNGEICMLSQTFSDTEDSVITCSATPFDGEDLENAFSLNGDGALEIILKLSSGGGGVLGYRLEEGTQQTYFWGSDANDILGENYLFTESFIEIENTPPVVSNKSFTMTDDTACSIDDNHKLYCWGRNITSNNADGNDNIILYESRPVSGHIDITPKQSNGSPAETLSLSFTKIEMASYYVPYGTDIVNDLSWFEDYEWFETYRYLSSGRFFDEYVFLSHIEENQGMMQAAPQTIIIRLHIDARLKWEGLNENVVKP